MGVSLIRKNTNSIAGGEDFVKRLSTSHLGKKTRPIFGFAFPARFIVRFKREEDS
jgi:hypothetical protein